MKNIVFIILTFMMIFTACEDIVEIDLAEGPVEVVVDAWINTDTMPQVIKLRTTAPYFSNAFVPVVNDAEIVVTDEDGRSYEFLELENSGNYIWTPEPGEHFGEIDKQYTLEISLDGKTYTAASQLNPTVPVDTITYEFQEEMLDEPAGYFAQFFARDQPGLGDTYWIKAYKNGAFLDAPQEINIAYDGGPSAGAEIDGLVFITPIREAINPFIDIAGLSTYSLGDTIRVEIHSLTPEAFTYLERARIQLTLGDAALFAEPPTNVPTNIRSSSETENPQGFFVVSEVSSLEVVVEE